LDVSANGFTDRQTHALLDTKHPKVYLCLT